jgi:peptidoglycan/LPS O-acetylase OafA/YrhL
VGQDKTANTRTRAPGLDGVRALAVLAVMGFHEGASEFSGGFLGVDVFFVLSGFLITDLLVVQYDRLGRLGLKNFWARRARRLLPPLAVMLIVVTAAATVIEPSQQTSLRLALLAAATYTSNWYQILHHVSYFATFGPLPPLDHLWSLAIEEQFYLIWPLILWFVILRLNGRRARVTATLIGAAMSAVAMALEYTPGNPSLVYYGTDTHAFALLIGAALALAFPLATLASMSAVQMRRLDAAGVVGLVVLAWAAGHFTGDDSAVYPIGLILAAVGAAGLVAAASSNGVIAAMTGLPPLRWLGIRSYGVYLWHWPVIALAGALLGSGPTSPWLWLLETCVAIALACASWRFIETPILQNGFRATCRHWWRRLIDESLRPTGGRRHVVPTAVATAAVVAVAVAGYGVMRSPQPVAPTGLLRQVAEGQRIGTASRAAQSPETSPAAADPQAAPGPTSACPQTRAEKVPGWQVTAVGDSVMVASTAALVSAMPGIYVDAQVGRQMTAGLAVLQSLAASGELRHYVVVGLGTNGTVTDAQIRQLRRIIGPDRDLVLIDTFGPMSWEPAVNAVLAAATRYSHVDLADWHQAIADRTYLLWPDGIHPQPSGAKLYARVVVAAVRAELPRVPASACGRSASRLHSDGPP